jgi:hypothetical protein
MGSWFPTLLSEFYTNLEPLESFESPRLRFEFLQIATVLEVDLGREKLVYT